MKRELIIGIVLFAIGVILGLAVGRERETVRWQERVVVKTDTVTKHPVTEASTKVLGHKKYIVACAAVRSLRDTSANEEILFDGPGSGGKPRCCVEDSMEVELPVVQRHYTDSLYEAWVSGPAEPQLDSIRVYRRTEYVTQRSRERTKRWHIGVTAGYGYTTSGMRPYIGVGITYSIKSL